MAVVKVRQNGPCVIEGDDVVVVDWNGDAYAIDRRPVALCRCGASAKKPFCDRTHARVGFTDETPAQGSTRFPAT